MIGPAWVSASNSLSRFGYEVHWASNVNGSAGSDVWLDRPPNNSQFDTQLVVQSYVSVLPFFPCTMTPRLTATCRCDRPLHWIGSQIACIMLFLILKMDLPDLSNVATVHSCPMTAKQRATSSHRIFHVCGALFVNVAKFASGHHVF